jgi:putative monooxygenase ydhR
MYALVSVWTTAQGQLDEQLRGLHEQVVPRVTKLPGFVAGYWTRDPVTGKAHGLAVFENETEARRLKEFIQGDTKRAAEAGMTYDSLAIVEVLASATPAVTAHA